MTVTQRPPVEMLLVDLDDCLYEAPGLSTLVAEKIREYMVTRLNMPLADVEEKCRELYLNYGTTLAGLTALGHTVDFDDWHAFVHGTLPYEDHLRPDPKLKHILDSILVPKYIFTNADAVHAERCLELLGLRGCFKGVICFETIMEAARQRGMVHHNTPVVCKPNRHAFELALAAADGAEAATTAFFDDSARNIASAHRMGILSVLVGRTGVDCPSHLQLHSMHDLPTQLPWLMAVSDGRPPTDDLAVAVSSPAAVEELEEVHVTAVTVRA